MLFMDGLQQWVKMEIWRRHAQNLATAISIVESLGSTRRGQGQESHETIKEKEGPQKRRKPKEGSKDGNSKGWNKPKRSPVKCFLCDGPHRVFECSKRNTLLAMVTEKELGRQTQGAYMDALQLAAVAAKATEVPHGRKGRLFAPLCINGQTSQTPVDTGASNNFLKLEVGFHMRRRRDG